MGPRFACVFIIKRVSIVLLHFMLLLMRFFKQLFNRLNFAKLVMNPKRFTEYAGKVISFRVVTCLKNLKR